MRLIYLNFSEVKKIYFERQRNYLNNLRKFSKSTKNNNISKEPKDGKKKPPRKKSNNPKLVVVTQPNPTTNEVIFESNNNLDQFNKILSMIASKKNDEEEVSVSPNISGNNFYI
jgi:hypothetical protein